MKKSLVMAAMVLSSVGAFAQTTIQPKVGFNTACVGETDWKAGLVAGVELQHQLSSKTGLAVGALYSVQGGKDKNTDLKWSPAYINVPITLNYYVAEGFALKAGVQPGFMVSKDEKSGIEKPKTFDFSVPVGLSYEFSNIVLDARYNIGCTKVFDFSESGYNNVVQITVGYKFAL